MEILDKSDETSKIALSVGGVAKGSEIKASSLTRILDGIEEEEGNEFIVI